MNTDEDLLVKELVIKQLTAAINDPKVKVLGVQTTPTQEVYRTFGGESRTVGPVGRVIAVTLIEEGET